MGKLSRETPPPREGEPMGALAEESRSDVRDVDISVDGTYMTRGHTSNIGVVTAIGLATGKVLDTGVKSKQCKSCDYWKQQDPTTEKYAQWQATHECTATHKGSSGSMEAEIAKDKFARSNDQYKLRYSRFIGDGDVNTFRKVLDSKPYGDEVDIQKIDCVGHVQKRMGTRLRNLKKSLKKTQLADVKPTGGKGRLTDAEMNKMQAYYGNAKRANKGNLEKLREAVWAVS